MIEASQSATSQELLDLSVDHHNSDFTAVRSVPQFELEDDTEERMRQSTAASRRTKYSVLEDNSSHEQQHTTDYYHHRHPASPPSSIFSDGIIGAHPQMRWLILALSCFIMFGNYYAFDNPSALNVPLRREEVLAPMAEEALFQYRLNMMYSAYSIPNVVLPFFVGHLVDEWGSGRLLLVLSVLVTGGQALTALGIANEDYAMVILGRIIFGLGGESLAVAQSRLVTGWFAGKELALALGLNLSIARIGTVVNNLVSPWLAETWSVATAFWFGCLMCFLSLLATMATVALDYYAHKEEATIQDLPVHAARKQRSPWHLAFERPFILVVFICFLFNGCMVPYNNVASDYLQTKYFQGSLMESNAVMSIPDTLAMLLVPLVGWAVDYTGARLVLLTAGALAFMGGHGLLGWGSHGLTATIALAILSVGYSSMLGCWACVPPLVRSSRQSMAYGLLTSACNLSITLNSLVVASLVAADPSYALAGIFFTLLASLALVTSITLHIWNRQSSLHLNNPDDMMRRHSSPLLGTMAEMITLEGHGSEASSVASMSPYR